MRDSDDRYANIEMDHLLQRMQHSCGLAILVMTRKPALDRAFLGRQRGPRISTVASF